MTDLASSELPVITIAEIPDILRYAMSANDADPMAEIVVSLEGDPGTGKTSIPRSVASEEGWKYTMILAPHLDLVEGKGYPVHNPEEDKVKFVPLDIWPTEPGPGIILIDEIAQAIPAVQASLSSLLFGRKMGNYILPDGWLIVTTGNLHSNKAATHRMPTHIRNRLQRYHVKSDVDTFLQFGRSYGLDETMLRFLANRPGLLHDFSPEAEICPTMRKWQKVSAVLKANPPETVRDVMIQAEVGKPAAAEFTEYLRGQSNMPKYRDVVTDPEGAKLVEENSYITALMHALGRRGKAEHAEELCTYVQRYEGEYQVVFLTQVKTENPSKLREQEPIQALAKRHSINM